MRLARIRDEDHFEAGLTRFADDKIGLQILLRCYEYHKNIYTYFTITIIIEKG